jgi:AcrR family transcriptional regulator
MCNIKREAQVVGLPRLDVGSPSMMKTDTIPEDHRVRVGAQRREKTRLRLLQSAVEVFSQKGMDASVIDDVIAAAGVSRGTFYNYFSTSAELVRALVVAMSDEIVAVINPIVMTIEDPLVRLSYGARTYIRIAALHPAWGRIITNIGPRLATRGQLIDRRLKRDLTEALGRKRIAIRDLLVARDAVLGAIFYGMETMLLEHTDEQHAEQLVATFLRGLGVDPAEADEIAFMPLPDIGPIQGPIFSSLPEPGKPARPGGPRR